MEMVEILLKGADIDKSFNNQPIAWLFQFCEPNWDEMLTLLSFKISRILLGCMTKIPPFTLPFS